MTDKVDSRAKKITRVRERDYILMRGSIHKAMLSVYPQGNRDAKYVKQTW